MCQETRIKARGVKSVAKMAPPVYLSLLLSSRTFFVLVIAGSGYLESIRVPQLDDVIFDSLDLGQFPVPSLSRCVLSCSQDARCVSVFYQDSRGQCRLKGGRFYLAQGGREEQGWRYFLLEMGEFI